MKPVVKVKDLVQKSRKKVLLSNLNVEIHRGELFGLFGPRGAGKTALLHILAGVDRFSAGIVEILGHDIRRSEKFKKKVGLVTQRPSLFADMNVAENLDYIATLKNCGRASVLDLTRRFELENILNEPVQYLKPGPYQRLAVACALLNDPELLIADELNNCLEPFSTDVINRELSGFLAGGGTCVWAFNNIGLCARMSRIGWLEEGQLSLYQPEEARRVWDNRYQAASVPPGDGHA
ncbi:MAG: ABC transporter ATP-binding protein [Desulfotomaculaceae bacterium]|nr:ABC transporter ATP-binding protein [Desulfotomaculaceae bacterium]